MAVMKRMAVCSTAALIGLAGCYTLEPAGTSAPQPGSVIALDITDAGRIALGGMIGPEISQVEGRLEGMDSTEYTVGVTTVRFLRGGDQVWHGETVRIKSAYVGSRYERRFSGARSAVLGAAAAGVVALVATQSLRGFGSGGTPEGPIDSSKTQRVPRRLRRGMPQRMPRP
jgi:hypothetical protein